LSLISSDAVGSHQVDHYDGHPRLKVKAVRTQ